MKKVVKLIMELIFIFILPLLFILLSIDVKKEDVYNTDNLLESEIKTFEYNNQLLIDIDDPYYINYLDYNQVRESISGSINATYEDYIQLNINNTELSYYDYYYVGFDIIITSGNNLVFKLGNPGYNEFYVAINGSGHYDKIAKLNSQGLNRNQSYFQTGQSSMLYQFTYENLQIINLTKMFGSGYEPSTIQELSNYIDLSTYHDYTDSQIITYESNTIISDNNKINYTPFGSLKHLVLDQFHLNDNFIVKVLFDYTVIWFVMFLLWHLFYGLFDGLIHMLSFDRKRE